MGQNILLSIMADEDFSRLEEYAETVSLQSRETLAEPDVELEYVWFPLSGVCSTLIHVDNGEAVEVGLIGSEGLTGLSLVLGGQANPFHVLVQAPGEAIRFPRDAFMSKVLQAGQPFCDGLLKYAHLFLANVAQTAACNRLHRIEQRLARWLLEMDWRIDSDTVPLTHELLGMMVGAYRPSVTNALKAFEDRGLLTAGRGQVTLKDRAGLRGEACECLSAIQTRTSQTMDRIRDMAA